MAESWRDTLQTLGISTTPVDPPRGAEGTWFLLLAVFGTSGFLRVLTDGATLQVELAAPRGADKTEERLQAADWSVDEPGPPLIAHRPFPADEEALRDLWIAINHWGEAVRADDVAKFENALAPPKPPPVAATESATEETKSSSPFETIGDDDRPPLAEGRFAFALEVEAQWVDAVLGFAAVLGPDEYEALERTLIRNLRAKYDVDVRAIAAHEVEAALEVLPETKLALRVTPDAVVRAIDLEGARRAAAEYFGNIEGLAESGIDPLVFLGVRTSSRLVRTTVPISPISSDEPPSRSDLLIDDSPDEPVEPDTNVVLSVPYEPQEGAPLEPGCFDDPRLSKADATTALVDVVMRHPGYSDRRIGQVLTILLSEEYSNCLELAARTPVVIAWGVALERARTMKTVVEGAGGKVLLVEPGTFEAQ